MLEFVVHAFRVLLLQASVLTLLTGCTTNDYRNTAYYRTTQQRIEAALTNSKQSGESSKLFAGTARVDITPPIGTPLQGFGARRGEPSTGVHDPLYARVLVLKNARSQLVIVSCDLMGVTRNLYDAIFDKVRRTIPLDRRELDR